LKNSVHFEIISVQFNFSSLWNKILGCFILPQGHPRCRYLCFHSSFNFYIFRSNLSCLSVI